MGAPYPEQAAARVRLQADSIGCRVPRDGRGGRIEAIFDGAWLVAMDDGGLVAVLAHRAGNVAHGIRLVDGAWPAGEVRLAMPVRIGAERMSLDGGALMIGFAGARTWSAGLRQGICGMNARSAAALLCGELRDRAPSCGSAFLAVVLEQASPDAVLSRRIGAILPRLALATQSRDCDAALGLVAQLVGLGPGLTPSGDDFVIGWLAGISLAAASVEETIFLRTVCTGIGPLGRATTRVSRQHLEDACALEFSERLADLCDAVAVGVITPLLARRVEAQLAVGATSGADAAAGLAFALRDGLPNEK